MKNALSFSLISPGVGNNKPGIRVVIDHPEIHALIDREPHQPLRIEQRIVDYETRLSIAEVDAFDAWPRIEFDELLVRHLIVFSLHLQSIASGDLGAAQHQQWRSPRDTPRSRQSGECDENRAGDD